MYEFDYRRPGSVEEAVELLSVDADATLLAGGQTLLPMLKLRLGKPSTLVDIGRLQALRGIHVTDDAVTIGAMTEHAVVATSPAVIQAMPGLARLAGGIGDPLVRNMGTIGGSLAYSHPGADYPGAALGLGATIRTDRRVIGADDFFVDTLETALEPSEIIVDVTFPIPRRAGYIKFPSPASGYVMAGAFVAETDAGVRVAINGAAGCVFRHDEFEQALSKALAVEALTDIRVSDEDLTADLHASAEYRAQLATVAVRRAVAQAVAA